MRIGEQAYSDIMLRWAVRQTDTVLQTDPTPDGEVV